VPSPEAGAGSTQRSAAACTWSRFGAAGAQLEASGSSPSTNQPSSLRYPRVPIAQEGSSMPVGALPSLARLQVMERLESERFDCVVIGGGITGAGIAREAARRGLSVALLEAHDFAAGTSSRSSKLIHGGLRYLALGDVATVRSTALERKVIHRLAPHLAEPHWMVVPTRSRVGLMKVRAGITTYEKLGAVAKCDLHRNWSAADLERGEPLLDRAVYKHACLFREYVTDDARLVLANLRAAAGSNAVALNYAPVRNIFQQEGKAVAVEAVCQQTQRRLRVDARCVVNAAGPWVDAVRALEDPRVRPLLLLSKGIHVILRRERLPVRHIAVLRASDRRSIFVVPRGQAVYIGTTDTVYERGCEVWPEITLEDVTYLLEPLSRYYSVDPIEPEEVVAAWAGLRPLIARPGKKPSEIPRRDEVLIGPANVVTIAGGKLTGYRPMARATLEKAAELAGIALGTAPEEEPLPGGDFDGDLSRLAGRIARERGASRSCAERLVRLYGSEAFAVAELGMRPLGNDPDIVEGEVDWAVRQETATRLEDVLYRRTRAAFFHPEAREAVVAPMAERMAELLGWSPRRREEEEARARALLASDLGFRDRVGAAWATS
jgi:glycerol-3-phosphate dehydrogenase